MPTHEMILLLLIFRLNLHKVKIVLFSSLIFSIEFSSTFNTHTHRHKVMAHGTRNTIETKHEEKGRISQMACSRQKMEWRNARDEFNCNISVTGDKMNGIVELMCV